VDADDPRPLAQFQRVAQVIRERVVDGQYKVGSQLPSIAALAKEFGYSHMTIKQALAALASEGVVSSRRGVRAEVIAQPSATAPASIADRLTRVEQHVERLNRRVEALEDHDV
jgi:DNA-binding GntR family transcriptional regulator